MANEKQCLMHYITHLNIKQQYCYYIVTIKSNLSTNTEHKFCRQLYIANKSVEALLTQSQNQTLDKIVP